jgi:membrane protein implicated in regulation of membrane protease activity
VVVMMAAAEAMSPIGSLLGAFFTLLLYGVLPLSVVLYVMGAPGRRRARRAADMQAASAVQPDGSGHAPGDAVAPERKEP